MRKSQYLVFPYHGNGLMAFYLCIFIDFVELSFYIIVCRYDKYILRREKKKKNEKTTLHV